MKYITTLKNKYFSFQIYINNFILPILANIWLLIVIITIFVLFTTEPNISDIISALFGFLGVCIGSYITLFSVNKDRFEKKRLKVYFLISSLLAETDIFLRKFENAILNENKYSMEDYINRETNVGADPTRDDHIDNSIAPNRNIYDFFKENYSLKSIKLNYLCQDYFKSAYFKSSEFDKMIREFHMIIAETELSQTYAPLIPHVKQMKNTLIEIKSIITDLPFSVDL